MKVKIILISLIFCIGCSAVYKSDIAERERIFFKCLRKLPEGPEKVSQNDWNEVLEQCYEIAFDLSKKCIKRCSEKK